jgi:hypothetical protein
VRPLLLIGQDNCDLSVAKKVIQVNPDALAISKTKLGWVMHGLAGNYQEYHSSIVNVCCEENDEDIHQLVKSYMTFENCGVVTTSTDRRKSEEERSALEQSWKPL